MKLLYLILLLLCATVKCDAYKILAIFPYNGRSHHIFYSALIEELAIRKHEVTVINYHPVKKLPNLRQISLQDKENTSDNVDVEAHLKLVSNDILVAYDTAQVFKYIANLNCKELMTNSQIKNLVKSENFDLVIVEQFVTDCGLAIAHKLNAPTVGMTAHILMPWTYSRLGASNHPAFVPNHFYASGTKPNLLSRVKNAIINFGMNLYYREMIQKSDQQIVNDVYPEIPSLEELGKNMSLIMLNQYFPITGPRLYGPNVIEVGGMHIKQHNYDVDKALQKFLDTSDTGVVYISFGTVASNFPSKVIDEIIQVIEKSTMRFVWKTDITDWKAPSNVFLGKWMAQVPILCHPKVVAFVTHSGMLSTSEAMHCGVPVVSVPLFGDQPANGAAAVENGLGVMLDIITLDEQVLSEAVQTVLQDKYQKKAKMLSQLWRDRPLSPLDTATYWIEYVARNQGDVNMIPPTVDLPFYQYYMLDLLFMFGSIVVLVIYSVIQVLFVLISLFGRKKNVKKEKRKKNA